MRFERRPSQRFSRRPSFERAQAEAARQRELERSDKKKETLQRIDGPGAGVGTGAQPTSNFYAASTARANGEQIVQKTASATHATAAIVHGRPTQNPSPVPYSGGGGGGLVLADGCGCAPGPAASDVRGGAGDRNSGLVHEELVEHLYANSNVTHAAPARGSHRADPSSVALTPSNKSAAAALALLASSPSSNASVAVYPPAAAAASAVRLTSAFPLVDLSKSNCSLDRKSVV